MGGTFKTSCTKIKIKIFSKIVKDFIQSYYSAKTIKPLFYKYILCLYRVFILYSLTSNIFFLFKKKFSNAVSCNIFCQVLCVCLFLIEDAYLFPLRKSTKSHICLGVPKLVHMTVCFFHDVTLKFLG